MLKSKFFKSILICASGLLISHAQMKTTVLIQSTNEDERISVSIDKSVYFPGDTILLGIQRNDSTTAGIITPILSITGTTLKSIGHRKYIGVIPQTVTPGLFAVSLRVTDPGGRRFVYETDCIVAVEEYQDVEQLSRYVSIIPEKGSNTLRTAVTIDRDQARNLEVRFQRDSIRPQMGPQFVRITTTVLLRDGIATPSYERRVVSFRSHGDATKDRAMFIQYRTAYGAYANIRPEELERVLVPVDSLPDWAILGIHVEPDYTIKIGAVDRSNTLTQYFRVRGPTFETGFSLAIPTVLYDSRADDPTEYGRYCAMVRFYLTNAITGNRFPVSAGIEIFGLNSPIDIGTGRGGFAMSMSLDIAEMIRIVNIGFTKKVNIGVELAPFFPIKKKARMLFVSEFGFSF
ncbi:MAG: hypothetical protein EHM64_06420 [Ignavibacteriae bacterium]|nr:MAG: hypothetical protein EHM64_06420 [Ignavibacteriota bacterium]